jgi:hypothetical protein
MSRSLVIVLPISFIVFIWFIVLASAPKKGDVIRIDCTWSEISPDMTPEVKELCRKARSGRI